MKKLFILLIAILFTHLCMGQNVKNLKGKVKRIVESIYGGSTTDTKVDTTQIPSKCIYLFNEIGNEVEESIYDKNGLLERKYVNKYNAKSECIEKDCYDKGKFSSKGTFKYDNNGNQIEVDSYSNPNSIGQVQLIYKYDNTGKRVEEDFYTSNGEWTNKIIPQYDNKGNKVEEDWCHPKDGNISGKYTFEYNEAGDDLKNDMYNGSGVLQNENNYTYGDLDKKGNWLLQIIQTKGQSVYQGNFLYYRVIKRRIYYF